MRAYTNKTDKVDSRKCTYAEIIGNNRARKKAARRQGKNIIQFEYSIFNQNS